MADQALLDRARPDAMARARDHVVVTTDEEDVAVLVLLRLVAGVEPPVADLRRSRLLAAPVAEERDGVAVHPHADLAVDDAHLVTGVREPHRAGSGLPGAAVADEEVRLGLPVELVEADAEALAAPVGGLDADGLAAARDGPEGHGRPRVVAPHQPERRRRHEDVADAGPPHQVEGTLGVELPAAVGDDGPAVPERRHQHVVEAADPRPVGRCPDDVTVVREVVVRELEAGQVAGEHPVAVQGALGRSGRARGVDEECRRVGCRGDRLEAWRRVREQPLEIAVDVDERDVEPELGDPLQGLDPPPTRRGPRRRGAACRARRGRTGR